jgi:hypothetical protein
MGGGEFDSAVKIFFESALECSVCRILGVTARAEVLLKKSVG